MRWPRPPRKFGRGEFDVRVTGYEGRCDEISTLAESFNTMANSLAKVESQRSEFIANVSHELKTPMTTISGFAEGILDGTIPPERERESLQIIVSETRRLSRLVRRMLDLSRLNALAEDTVTAQEQFDLTEVVSPGAHQPGDQDHRAEAGRGRADARRQADGVGRPGLHHPGLL